MAGGAERAGGSGRGPSTRPRPSRSLPPGARPLLHRGHRDHGASTTDGPVGFACQSFAALSLDPPLVLFCPGSTSRTWPRIERAGHFCVNVLADGQRDVSRVFGSSGRTSSPGCAGRRRRPGRRSWRACSTWVGCTVETVHEAGDHHVVLGRVTELGAVGPGRRCCSTAAATRTPARAARPAGGRRHAAGLAPAHRLDLGQRAVRLFGAHDDACLCSASVFPAGPGVTVVPEAYGGAGAGGRQDTPFSPSAWALARVREWAQSSRC